MSVSTFSSDFVHTALIQMGANQIMWSAANRW